MGDRYVLEAMRAGGYNLGGEQSGHVIMLDHATTGDGLLTSLHLLAVMARAGKSLAELASVMTRLPQVLINVKDVDRDKVSAPELSAAVAAAEAELGETGRVLIRPSGTEPMIRVMVEAASEEQADQVGGPPGGRRPYGLRLRNGSRLERLAPETARDPSAVCKHTAEGSLDPRFFSDSGSFRARFFRAPASFSFQTPALCSPRRVEDMPPRHSP